MNTPYDIILTILKDLPKEIPMEDFVISEFSDLINFCVFDYSIYVKYDINTLTLSCLLIYLEIKNKNEVFDFIFKYLPNEELDLIQESKNFIKTQLFMEDGHQDNVISQDNLNQNNQSIFDYGNQKDIDTNCISEEENNFDNSSNHPASSIEKNNQIHENNNNEINKNIINNNVTFSNFELCSEKKILECFKIEKNYTKKNDNFDDIFMSKNYNQDTIKNELNLLNNSNKNFVYKNTSKTSNIYNIDNMETDFNLNKFIYLENIKNASKNKKFSSKENLKLLKSDLSLNHKDIIKSKEKVLELQDSEEILNHNYITQEEKNFQNKINGYTNFPENSVFFSPLNKNQDIKNNIFLLKKTHSSEKNTQCSNISESTDEESPLQNKINNKVIKTIVYKGNN